MAPLYSGLSHSRPRCAAPAGRPVPLVRSRRVTTPADRFSLLGSQHHELGAIATRALPPGIGAAISAGRFPKPVAPVDVNEDAVFAAAGGGATLLAVADGHGGFEAAHAAVTALDLGADQLLDMAGEPVAAVRAALRVAVEAAREAAALAPPARRASETALTVAVTRAGAGAVGTVGDTACAHLGRRPATPGRPSPFSGHPRALDRAHVSRLRLGPDDRLVLVTDGFSDFAGRRWEHRLQDAAARHAGAEDLAAAAVGLALRAGASDNVAVAVWTAGGVSPVV